MKLKLVSTIILFDIVLIIFITYMLVQHNKTNGGFNLPKGQNVSIYGVILNDGGVNGEVLGCGDSLVPVRNYESEQFREVSEGLINEAVSELFALSNEIIGGDAVDGALFTAAYQPELTVDGVEINGSVANVFLSGKISMGGVCDTPRFEKQLERTATQFEGIDFARFYLNGSEENYRASLSSR
ncbi:MAG: GerMN domain-containing protein [Candidatus Peregrinibacteria bacterium]|nr:GerMN domain-containing protein [Candidatus Peregrinibacteria bacterium]MDZ4245476.1 GerMN domain-containing protein [Candidatus Gracilibacteria bacterium]